MNSVPRFQRFQMRMDPAEIARRILRGENLRAIEAELDFRDQIGYKDDTTSRKS